MTKPPNIKSGGKWQIIAGISVGEGLDPPSTYRCLSVRIVRKSFLHVILSERSASKDLRTDLT